MGHAFAIIGWPIAVALVWTTACSGKSVVDGPPPSAGGGGQAGAGGQGGQGGQVPCGDPALLAAFAGCLAADGQAACEAAGGTWDIIGLAPSPSCQCLTGQAACLCTDNTQCLSACVAEPLDGVTDCTGITSGHCSAVSVTVGCWCLFDDTGNMQGYCID
jgi:hypothetical protein